jgi:hypothetical protein
MPRDHRNRSICGISCSPTSATAPMICNCARSLRPWALSLRVRSSISVASRGSFSDRTGACSLAGSIGNIRTKAVPITLGLVIAGRHAPSMEHTEQARGTALYYQRRPLVKNNLPILMFGVFRRLGPIKRRYTLNRVDS